MNKKVNIAFNIIGAIPIPGPLVGGVRIGIGFGRVFLAIHRTDTADLPFRESFVVSLKKAGETFKKNKHLFIKGTCELFIVVGPTTYWGIKGVKALAHFIKESRSARTNQEVKFSSATAVGGRELVESFKNYLEINKRLTTEGIFRVPGNKNEIYRLKKRVNKQINKEKPITIDYDSLKTYDFSGLLMHYLAEIPGKVFPENITNQLLEPNNIEKILDRTIDFSQLFGEDFPFENRGLVLDLLGLCSLIASHAEMNHMDAHNLALCLTPVLFPTIENSVDNTQFLSMALEQMIEAHPTYYAKKNPFLDE